MLTVCLWPTCLHDFSIANELQREQRQCIVNMQKKQAVVFTLYLILNVQKLSECTGLAC